MDEREYHYRWAKYDIALQMASSEEEKLILHKEFFNCTHENKKPLVRTREVRSDTTLSDGYWYGDQWVEPMVVPGTKLITEVIAEDIACDLCQQKDPRKRKMIYEYTIDEIYGLVDGRNE